MKHYVGVVCLALIVGGFLWLREASPASELPHTPIPHSEEVIEEWLRRSRLDMARVQMQRLSHAIELHRLKHMVVPASLGDLTKPDEHGARFMNEVVDDPWGNPYDYGPDGKKRFHLRSAGPDGELDTEDDIVHGVER